MEINKVDSKMPHKHATKGVLQETDSRIPNVADLTVDDTSSERLIKDIWESMAKLYRDNLAMNIARGKQYNAEHALYNGYRIFGYKVSNDKKYVEDPNTAPIVPRIFSDYASGKPLRDIADELNSQGIRTLNGKMFNVENLRRILKNDKYTGLYHFDTISVPGGMPQLVSQDLFDEVQKRLELNKRGRNHAVEDSLAPFTYADTIRDATVGIDENEWRYE